MDKYQMFLDLMSDLHGMGEDIDGRISMIYRGKHYTESEAYQAAKSLQEDIEEYADQVAYVLERVYNRHYE